jgi:HEAT repeat protein
MIGLAHESSWKAWRTKYGFPPVEPEFIEWRGSLPVSSDLRRHFEAPITERGVVKSIIRVSLIALGTVVLVAPLGCAPQKNEPARQADGKKDSAQTDGTLTKITESASANLAAEADVPTLTARVAGPDSDARWRAARSLGDVGPKAASAVPALLKALGDTEPRVRGHAARALGLIGEKSDDAIKGLVGLVADPDPRVRRAAISALVRLRPVGKDTFALLVQVLEDADPAVVMPALQSLAEGGTAAVPALIEGLKHKEGRYWACIALAEMGPQAKDAVPQLTSLLSDDEPEVRMEAVMALGEIGPDAVSATPALIKTLADATPAVRYAAGFSLGKIGATAALPDLEKAEHDPDPFFSLVAAWAVAKLKPDDKESLNTAIELIVAALKNQDANVRRGAAKALWELNAPPEVVGTALVAALEDADPVVQANVYAGLASLGQVAVPRLLEKLADPRLRDKAMRVLALMGSEAKLAVPPLTEALPGANAQERRDLLFTLASIGPDSAAATAAIVPLLADSDEDVRVAAAYALGKIGPGASAAVDALRKYIDGQDRTLRLVSIWALLRIKPDDSQIVQIAVPELTNVVTQGETDLARTEAAAALGDIGAQAKPARSALQKALSDDSLAVREAAAEALVKIGE